MGIISLGNGVPSVQEFILSLFIFSKCIHDTSVVTCIMIKE